MIDNQYNRQRCSNSKFIFSLGFWIILAASLTGCNQSNFPPTPTPTKTPLSLSRDDGTFSIRTTSTPVVIGSDGEVSTTLGELTTSGQAASVVATPTKALVISDDDNGLTALGEPKKEIVVELADPTPIPGDLAPFTGLPVDDPARLSSRPMIVCINNDAAGRAAHYGLSQADVVYEYIVDGFSVTRMAAIYQSQDVKRVGPVRSARLPNVWMTAMYDGALACSGGSDPIRYLLTHEANFPYLDADRDDPNNSRYFSSIGKDYRTRLQTSTSGLQKWLSGIGQESDWDRDGFQFDSSLKPNYTDDATIIKIRYPGGGNVEWHYDADLGGYTRYQAGQQQWDPGTDQPVVAKNIMAVVAVHTETDIVEDSLGTRSVDIQLYGTGDLRLFRDGVVYEGVWHAYSDGSPRWLDLNAQAIPLKPGGSWVQVIRNFNEISYQ